MAESASADTVFDAWKRQIEEGTQAWAKAVGQMGAAAKGPAADPLQFWRPFLDPSMESFSKLFGQGPPGPEMIAQWKPFLDQWIAAWSKVLQDAMSTDAFAQALGQYLDKWLSVQGPAKKMAEESTAATLQALGMPSRHQVVGIAQQLMDLDDRIDGVDDRLVALMARMDEISNVFKNQRPAAARRGTQNARVKQTRSNDKSSDR